MKKLVFLLCLCLCLNGAVVAEENAPAGEEGTPAVETVEQQPEASNDAQQDDKTQDAPASNAPQSNDAGQSGNAEQSGGDSQKVTTDSGVTDDSTENNNTDGGTADGANDTSVTDDGTAGRANDGTSDNNTSGGGAADGSTDNNPANEGDSGAIDGATGDTSTDGGANSGAADGTGENNTEDIKTTESPTDTNNVNKAEGNPEPTDESIPENIHIEGKSSGKLDEYEARFKWDDERFACGTLEDVLNAVLGQKVGITLSANKIVDVRKIEKADLKQLSDITLNSSDNDYNVLISLQDPREQEGPELTSFEKLSKEDKDTADLYIWLNKPEQTPSEPEPAPTPAPALSVAVEGKTGAEWANAAPVFTLSGIPEGKAWSYAAVIYDERFVPLSGNTYTPTEEGVYTVRLVMLDELGDIVSASEKYTLWLDWTEPNGVSVRMDTETSYVVYLESSDAISGVEAISMDGGATWDAMTDGEEYRYEGSGPRTFAAGEILVRDAAGNICPCEQEVELHKVEKENNYSFGGGGSSGTGTDKPAKTHASGDGEDTGEYEALRLELPEEPMRQLTVDGESMALTLVLESAQEPGAPVGQQRLFNAEWARWGGVADAEPDTLVLSAELDDNLGDSFTYAWHFNGEVYRMLSNSGIKYVALKVGDDIAAFPTEGFTGGTKYTELKMLGVSTRRFDYTLTMKVNLDPAHVTAMTDSDFSRDCDLSIRTEVENMSYELSSSPQSIMYFYDVYLGPGDMLNQPFGQYRTEAQ